MNGYQRIQAALRGETPDRTPVMLHNFMLAARQADVPMSRYRRDPSEIARCLIESVEKYDTDGVVLDIDTATLAGALGVPVEYPEDQPAVCRRPALADLSEVDRLEEADIARFPGVQVWLEAARLLSRHFHGEIFVRGNCDQCPFSLASMMCGSEAWMLALLEPSRHAFAHRLLEHCARATIQFVRLMSQTGADMLSNGDSPAGPELISPRLYREFAQPYEEEVAAAAHGTGLPYALHICGSTDLILEDMVATGADALELDYRTDSRKACRILKDRATFIGNIDPTGVLAQGDPKLVEAKTRELIGYFRGNPRFILNAGCAIPPSTPPSNLLAMLRCLGE
jgi:uroporphyrinogen decarboxylase